MIRIYPEVVGVLLLIALQCMCYCYLFRVIFFRILSHHRLSQSVSHLLCHCHLHCVFERHVACDICVQWERFQWSRMWLWEAFNVNVPILHNWKCLNHSLYSIHNDELDAKMVEIPMLFYWHR